MDEPIQTMPFTINRKAYFRTMYTYNLWRPVATYVIVIAVLSAAADVLIDKWIALGGAIGLAIAIPLLFVVRYFRLRRNVFSPEMRQVFDDPRTTTFSDWGMHTVTQGGAEGKLPWTHVVKAVPRDGFTLLFSGKIVHNIVPDTAFASPSDYAAFLSLLNKQSFQTLPKKK